MGFPIDDYTPYGYLANPAARATSWRDLHGGSLRTATDLVGCGWSYPWDRRPTAVVDLALRLTVGARRYVGRDDWAELGLHSAYHSSRLFSFNWSAADVTGAWRLCLADDATLVGVVELRNEAPFARACRLEVLARAGREVGTPTIEPLGTGWRLAAGDPAPPHALLLLDDGGLTASPLPPLAADDDDALPAPAGLTGRAAGLAWEISLAPGQVLTLAVALRRGEVGGGRWAVASRQSPVASGGDDSHPGPLLGSQLGDPHPRPRPEGEGVVPSPPQPSVLSPQSWVAAEAAARAADEAFYAGAPLLAGDWPAAWRRGWVYDLETTRLCLQPASGIFSDVWPTWMVHWPRVVVAEGTLDMLRLAYAAPELAKRAVLTLFRDAPAPNVPCVFAGGEPNMVAKDGSVCGTSPAWCLPFYNIEALYRWTLDRAWLAALYPHLAAYLRWWLAERRDAAGWIVYRCTWEAGEDNSPRLDPAGEGDHVITEFTRPVELQAMLAVSAGVLGRLASELGRADERAVWAAVAADFQARTRQLWDAAAGRFRDWDKRANAFVQPAGRAVYWDADPARYSPLSLTPLLDGVATPEQALRLGAELPAYDVSPWCDWPSWTYAIVESAAAAGYHAFAARLASRVIERVYRRADRRDLHGFARPLPGVAPEYWPTDVATYTGSDGYGWGATTLSLLLRQVIGLTESPTTDRWSLCLTPGLPAALLRPGAEYRLVGLTYRDRQFDLTYRVGADGALTAGLRFAAPVGLTVEPVAGVAEAAAPLPPPRHSPSATEHRLPVEHGRRYRLTADA